MNGQLLASLGIGPVGGHGGSAKLGDGTTERVTDRRKKQPDGAE